MVAIGIGVLAVAVAAAWLWIGQRADPSLGRIAFVAGWMAALAGLAAAGMLFPPLFLAGLAMGLGVGSSPTGARIAAATPWWALVGLQGFRLPLELVMHRAASIGLMPVQMSFAGDNLDILAGAFAIPLAAWLYAGGGNRGAVVSWNVLGVVTLANIVYIAIASLPMFAAFGADPAHLNTWVFAFPYCWLPGVLVPSAALGHLLVGRKLAATR